MIELSFLGGAATVTRSKHLVRTDGDQTIVIAVDPMQTMAAESNELRPIAQEVRAKLARVLERVV